MPDERSLLGASSKGQRSLSCIIIRNAFAEGRVLCLDDFLVIHFVEYYVTVQNKTTRSMNWDIMYVNER